MTSNNTRLDLANRDYRVAAGLGLCALFINTFALILDPERSIPAGNIFCFIAALSLGAPAGAISGALSLLPRVVATGEFYDTLRMISLLALLGYSTKRWRKLPGFMITASVWLFLTPTSLFLFSQPGYRVALMALSETALTLLASAALLNRDLYGTLTQKPRHTELKDICTLGAACMALAGYAVALFFYWAQDSQAFMENSVFLALAGLMLMIVAVLGLGRLFADLQNNVTYYIPTTLTQNTFSGLSATNWRRPGAKSGDHLEYNDGEELAKRWNSITDGKANPSAKEGVIAIKEDGEISFVNRAFRSLSGITESDIVGRSIFDITITPELKEALTEMFSNFKTSSEKSAEIKLNQLPEKLKYLELTAEKSEDSPHASLRGGPNSIVITIKDISERRTVENHLIQGQRLSSLGSTVKGLAHSLNNYLTSVAGNISVARKSEDTKKIHSALDDAALAVQSAGTLIRNLLEYAHSKPGKLVSVDASSLVSKQGELLERILGPDVKFKITNSKETIGIVCDPHLIVQSLTNLILNAKESLAEDQTQGQVNLELCKEEVVPSVARLIPGARPGLFARFTVEDNGQGMTSDVMSKAFDPLFSTKSKHGNTGLGLSMVYAIARAHDGFLSLDSQPGKGTKLSIYLPYSEFEISEQSDLADTKSDSQDSDLATHSEKILVVEDDAQVREIVSEMLLAIGYKVQSCDSGPNAVSEVEKEHFDLVLVDMMMPDMSGTELIEKIRSINDKTKTLIMTGSAASETASAKDTPVMPKPFDLDTLAKQVKAALGNH